MKFTRKKFEKQIDARYTLKMFLFEPTCLQ